MDNDWFKEIYQREAQTVPPAADGALINVWWIVGGTLGVLCAVGVLWCVHKLGLLALSMWRAPRRLVGESFVLS